MQFLLELLWDFWARNANPLKLIKEMN